MNLLKYIYLIFPLLPVGLIGGVVVGGAIYGRAMFRGAIAGGAIVGASLMGGVLLSGAVASAACGEIFSPEVLPLAQRVFNASEAIARLPDPLMHWEGGSAPTHLEGTLRARYPNTKIRRMGEGVEGLVFKVDLSDGPVAIKMIKPGAKEKRRGKPIVEQQELLRELLGRIQRPGFAIVPTKEGPIANSVRMEWIEGVSLAKALSRRSPLDYTTKSELRDLFNRNLENLIEGAMELGMTVYSRKNPSVARDAVIGTIVYQPLHKTRTKKIYFNIKPDSIILRINSQGDLEMVLVDSF